MPPKKANTKGISQAKADLPTYSLENQFRFNSRSTFTEDQLSVIDSIWNLSTSGNDNKIKWSILNTLIAQYFHYNTGRRFFHYCLFNGLDAGIYSTWKEISLKIQDLSKNPKMGKPFYKGYYSLDEAKKAIEELLGEDYRCHHLLSLPFPST